MRPMARFEAIFDDQFMVADGLVTTLESPLLTLACPVVTRNERLG